LITELNIQAYILKHIRLGNLPTLIPSYEDIYAYLLYNIQKEIYVFILNLLDQNKLSLELEKKYEIFEKPPFLIKKIIKKPLKLKSKNKRRKQIKVENNHYNYSQKQIAIAYYVMGITIDDSNAMKILLDHSQTKSVEKLLSKKVVKSIQITNLLGNKTANTKHLEDLREAKRLISGKKKYLNKKQAIIDIDRYITAFKTSYDNSE
jgi:hypothetical protein